MTLLQHAASAARRALRWLGWLCAGTLVLTAAAAALMLSTAPRVLATDSAAALSPAHVHQAVLWLRALRAQAAPHAPGATAAAAEPDLQPLPAQALQALAQDMAGRALGPAAGVRVQLLPGAATVAFSAPLHALPRLGAWQALPNALPQWLNIEARLGQAPGERLPQLQALRVGHLALPLGPRAQAVVAWLAQPLLQRAGWQARVNQVALGLEAVQQVQLQPEGLRVQLLPPLQLAQRLGELLLPGVPLPQLQPYCQQLAHTLHALPPGAPVPLHRVLGPLLALPAPPTTTPPQALQLATAAAALYAAQLPPGVLSMAVWCPLPAPRTVELAGRHDHALHFLLSALLAQGTHPMLADAIGLYKELADVGDPAGSGFSFDDLAADKAGAAFGTLSRQAPQQLLQRAAQMRSDAFLMPSVQGLPTQLSAEQLAKQLGGYGSPRYRAWVAEVERRVRAVPMLGG